MASDETMDDAPGASDEAREPLLKRVGASVEGTSLMNHRLMKNPKFRALVVESVRGVQFRGWVLASVSLNVCVIVCDF